MKLGIDIVEVRRIKRLIKSKRFLEKIFTKEEIKYCKPKKNASQHFAVRFAAKEAVWKALGKGGITHRDIGIKNLPSGKPLVTLNGKISSKILISLTHTDEYAAAVSVVK